MVPRRKHLKHWIATEDAIMREVQNLILENGKFDPIYFMELNFHMLRDGEFSVAALSELCQIVPEEVCEKCIWKFKHKVCILWKKLRSRLEKLHIERAPTCIRNAMIARRFSIAVSYFILAGLLENVISVRRITCKDMRKMGFCEPDHVCIEFNIENPLKYSSYRVLHKINIPVRWE